MSTGLADMPKCKLCKVKFDSVNSLTSFCSPAHAIEWLQSPEGKHATEKAGHKKRKADDRAQKEKKADYYRRHVSWQHKHTQIAFNKMRKIEELLWFRDNDKAPCCISCLKPWTENNQQAWHIGHYYSVGSSPALRYDRLNTHIQCAVCNTHLSGNINGTATTIGYKAGMVNRYGDKKGSRVLCALDDNKAKKHKWTWEEVENLRTEFNARTRSIKARLDE